MHNPPFQKIYLSRAMTRMMASEHPVGDPFGGAAYGEKRDPVTAIVAIGSMAASAGGAAALVAGTVTFGTVAAGLAFAGGALTLIGSVTGNKNLTKIGTIASVVGGVGGLLNGGFLTEVAKEGATEAVAANAADTVQAPAPDAGAPVAQPSVSEAIVDAQAPVNDALVKPAASAPVQGEGLIANELAKPPVDAAKPPIAPAAENVVSAVESGSSSVPQSSATKANMFNEVYGEAAQPPGVLDKVKGMLPDLSKLSTSDKLMAAKLASDVVGGAVNYIAPSPEAKAKTDYYAANTDKLRADEELRQQRLANLNRNMQMGLGISANQSAVKIAAPVVRTQPGLITNVRAA